MGSSFDDAVRALGEAIGGIAVSFKSGTSSAAQARVEERLLQVMCEFTDAPDDAVALLVRDEIINTQGMNHALLQWATADSVARIRRSILVAHMRQQAAEQARVAAHQHEMAASGHRPCKACRHYVRQGSVKCINCGAWSPTEGR